MELNKALAAIFIATVCAVTVYALITAYLVKSQAQKAVSDTVEAISPLNNDKIFATGVDNVGRKLSGNNNWSLGVWFHDVIYGTPEEQANRQAESGFIESIGGNMPNWLSFISVPITQWIKSRDEDKCSKEHAKDCGYKQPDKAC